MTTPFSPSLVSPVLVGRETQLSALDRLIDQTAHRHGHTVLITGEAGIGKSRLLAEIVRTSLGDAAQPGAQGPALALVQPHVHSRSRPYAIVADVLRRLYELPSQPDAAAQAIAAHVYERTPAQGRFLPLLQGLLGLPATENAITQALSPDERRARLHELVVLLIASYTRTRPTALVLEDLHWADAASIDVLSALAVASQALPLVLLCTTRPDDAPQWTQSAGPVRIVLERLPIVAAMSRSFRLIRNDFWRVFGIWLLGGIVAALVSGAVSIPFSLGGQLVLTAASSTLALMLALVLLSIGSAISQIITAPFSAGVVVLLYTDRRIRAEAFDLVLQTGAAYGPGAPADSTDHLWLTRQP